MIEKSFDPGLVLLGITPGDLAALEFTITNPNPFDPISGVAFVDNLPGGLVIASSPNVVDSGCGTPSISATAGSSSITVSGGSIAADGICVISVDVEGPVGVYDNTSGNVSHIVGGETYQGNQATDQLVIDNPIPRIALRKQVGLTNNSDGTWQDYLAVEVPTDVYYKLTAENIGELELTNLAVTDPAINITGCTWPGSLPVADFNTPTDHIAECIVGPVTISSAGEVLNTAEAGADSSFGAVSDTDSATTATVDLGFDKAADRSVFSAAGETINYTFTLTNNGPAILEAPVTVTDDLLNASCPSVTTVGDFDSFLETGESIACSGSYVTDSADVSAGQVDNTAFATVQGFSSPDDSVTVPLASPALSVVKQLTGNADEDGSGGVSLGDTLSYTITASNDGNVTLTNVAVSDDLTGDATSCPSLAPAAACVLSVAYQVAQDDVDAGRIDNTGAADSDQTGEAADTETVGVDQDAAIALDKQIVDGSPYAAVDDVITYTLTATNVGNVTLTNVSISDPGAVIGSCTPTQPTSLGPGQALQCSATHVVTSDEIDAGEFTNTATANAIDPNDEVVSDSDTATALGQVTGASLALAKQLTDAPDPVVLGSVLEFTVTATNNGDTALADVVVTDSKLEPDTEATCSELLPGESCQLLGTYTVTQADVDAGEVVNTATATTPDADDPEPVVLATPIASLVIAEIAAVCEDDAPYLDYRVEVSGIESPSLTIRFLADDGSDSLAYEFVGQPLSGRMLWPEAEVDASGQGTAWPGWEQDTDGNWLEVPTLVRPSAIVEFEVNPTAREVVSYPSATPDCVTGPPLQPALGLDKRLTDAPNPIEAGSLLTYTIIATNTGNSELSDVVVEDDRIVPGRQECSSLMPGDQCELVGEYEVTIADMEAGSIRNRAIANGRDPEGASVPEVDDEVVTPTHAGASALAVPFANPLVLVMLGLVMLFIGAGAIGRKAGPPLD